MAKPPEVTKVRLSPELLQQARQALAAAPNPRVVDGPPAYWHWYDGPRASALSALDQALG